MPSIISQEFEMNRQGNGSVLVRPDGLTIEESWTAKTDYHPAPVRPVLGVKVDKCVTCERRLGSEYPVTADELIKAARRVHRNLPAVSTPEGVAGSPSMQRKLSIVGMSSNFTQ